MKQRVTSGLTPLSPLQIASSSGPSAGSTAPPAYLPLAVRLTRRSPRGPLAREREKLNCRTPPRSGAVVVDPRASVWKIRLHPAGLSGENGLINLIPPLAIARNTKTRLRTPMTPMNPLTGLSQVLLRLPWPPAPLVTPPRHPSDGRGVFHSAPPCLGTWADTSSSYIVDHFVSLNAKADYSLSDLTELLSPRPFQC